MLVTVITDLGRSDHIALHRSHMTIRRRLLAECTDVGTTTSHLTNSLLTAEPDRRAWEMLFTKSYAGSAPRQL